MALSVLLLGGVVGEVLLKARTTGMLVEWRHLDTVCGHSREKRNIAERQRDGNIDIRLDDDDL